MNCPNCGNPVSDNATFCGSCGTAVNAQPIEPAAQPVYQAQPQATDNPYAKSALIMGIIAAVLSWLPIVSVILGIITIKKSRYALTQAPQLGKRPMCYIALGLGIEGIVVAAFMTVYWIVWIAALASIANVAYSYSYLY